MRNPYVMYRGALVYPQDIDTRWKRIKMTIHIWLGF